MGGAPPSKILCTQSPRTNRLEPSNDSRPCRVVTDDLESCDLRGIAWLASFSDVKEKAQAPTPISDGLPASTRPRDKRPPINRGMPIATLGLVERTEISVIPE